MISRFPPPTFPRCLAEVSSLLASWRPPSPSDHTEDLRHGCSLGYLAWHLGVPLCSVLPPSVSPLSLLRIAAIEAHAWCATHATPPPNLPIPPAPLRLRARLLSHTPRPASPTPRALTHV